MYTYRDSPYNNLDNGGFHGEFMVFLNDKIDNLTPIIWQSKRIYRVVNSAMAVETLASIDAAEASFWI